MKQFYRKHVGLLLILVMLTSILSVSTSTKVEAASKKVSVDKEVTYFANSVKELKETSRDIVVYADVKLKKYSNLKSSNPKVVEVVKEDILGFWDVITLKPKKFGSSIISFDCAGKTLEQKVTFRKWVNPLKTFKIGNKNYKKYFNKNHAYLISYMDKTIKGKVNVVPKKGWTVVKIVNNHKKIKNNNTAVLDPNKKGGIAVHLKNKKTNIVEVVLIGCSYEQTLRDGRFPYSNEELIEY